MDKNEITCMIDRYDLYDPRDGRLLVRKPAKTQQELDQIKAAKAEILAYFAAERAAFAAEMQRKADAFYAIPGVRELAEARAEWAEYCRKFNAAMDSESAFIPSRPVSDLNAIEAANPLAVWALKIDHERTSYNADIAEIAAKAYDAICNGANLGEAKAVYDQEIAALTERNLWD